MVIATPSVTVVIPTYNRREKLSRALRSVLAQTYPITEIVVVDDHSSDDTEAVVREGFPDVTYVRLPRQSGAPTARNVGVDRATSEYVAFLDSDDCFHPVKIEKQVTALLSTKAGFSTCAYQTPSGRRYKTEVASPQMLLWKNALGGTSGLVARTELLRANPFDAEMPAVQEWELYLRLVKRASFVHLTSPLYTYDDGGSDRITAQKVRRLEGHMRLFARHPSPPGFGGLRSRTLRALTVRYLQAPNRVTQRVYGVGLKVLG
ncbi:glycosyltransferase family 2 protein [Palleronia caenipelagi]|nr:glycosyltransferase family A protein [Palleronia caenipelagi]